MVYANPPVDEVICQLIFPPILRINRDIPVDFQESIRDDYPNYYPIVEGVPYTQQNNILPIIQDSGYINNGLMIPPQSKNHNFLSEDKSWKVNLTQNFVALSTKKYTTWVDFKSRLLKIIYALNEYYSVGYFERIGLRYIDVYQRSRYKQDATPWTELINDFVLGALSLEDVADDAYASVSDFSFKNGIKAKIMSSLVIDTKSTIPLEKRERCLMVDSDVYSLNRTVLKEIEVALGNIHEISSKLMDNTITSKMRELMGQIN